MGNNQNKSSKESTKTIIDNNALKTEPEKYSLCIYKKVGDSGDWIRHEFTYMKYYDYGYRYMIFTNVELRNYIVFDQFILSDAYTYPYMIYDCPTGNFLILNDKHKPLYAVYRDIANGKPSDL